MTVTRSAGMSDHSGPLDAARFAPELMVAAARLYYLQEATQAEIADRLGTSRPTVSRLLAEARRVGIVRIDVIEPAAGGQDELACRTAAALGLAKVWLVPAGTRPAQGAALAPAVRQALLAAELRAGDVLLVSSGRTVHAAAQADLPDLPGVVIVPTVGGRDEPEAWYQTNEITRQVADKVRGRPAFLYAPVLPSQALRQRLLDDPGTRAVLDLWGRARCALLGVGAPPLGRQSLHGSFSPDDPWLRSAVGDICARFYDRDGRPLAFPGSERLLSTDLETLQRIPTTIALATGTEKLLSIRAGARAGWFNQLVTDTATAQALLAAG